MLQEVADLCVRAELLDQRVQEVADGEDRCLPVQLLDGRLGVAFLAPEDQERLLDDLLQLPATFDEGLTLRVRERRELLLGRGLSLDEWRGRDAGRPEGQGETELSPSSLQRLQELSALTLHPFAQLLAHPRIRV